MDFVALGELKQWGKEQAAQIAAKADHYEYRIVDACGPSGSLSPDHCQRNGVRSLCPAGEGPAVTIYRRTVAVDGSVVVDWSVVGVTCRGNDVPGVAKRPTMAMIVQAFHHTSWARAGTGFQPAGNVTLVNLPNFYRASWTEEGFGPGEVDTVDPAQMFGHRVQIRPTLVGFTYHFGDGTSFGPTTSPGGVHPDGDVRHTYARTGTYRVWVTVRWGADFRVDDGQWQQVPDTVSVDQPATTVTVKDARARLLPT